MSARSFRSVGWVAGIGAAALGCYILSLQVAAERAELNGIEARIVRARQAIRDLQTELGTRGRLSQLEHWNAEVLALSAPVAGQFVENEAVLARLETHSDELGGGAPVRLASAETGATAPVVAAPQPQARTAAAPAPPATPSPPAATVPVVRRASLSTAPAAAPARPAPTRAVATTRPLVVQARAETRPVQTQARSAAPRAPARVGALLDERTARELGEAARSERRERRSAPPQPAAGGTARD